MIAVRKHELWSVVEDRRLRRLARRRPCPGYRGWRWVAVQLGRTTLGVMTRHQILSVVAVHERAAREAR